MLWDIFLHDITVLPGRDR
jgi:hypothetical protein